MERRRDIAPYVCKAPLLSSLSHLPLLAQMLIGASEVEERSNYMVFSTWARAEM